MVVQPQGPEDETKGIEMEQDFDGEMQDVPENPDANDDDPEEEGDDDRLDQEMGEGEEGDEVVDEKLWGEDEERPNDPDAKTEKDAPMKVPCLPLQFDFVVLQIIVTVKIPCLVPYAGALGQNYETLSRPH